MFTGVGVGIVGSQSTHYGHFGDDFTGQYVYSHVSYARSVNSAIHSEKTLSVSRCRNSEQKPWPSYVDNFRAVSDQLSDQHQTGFFFSINNPFCRHSHFVKLGPKRK